MTDRDFSAASGQHNQFREEAAAWFARMRGPDADSHREALDRWLELGALHRETYNRIADVWSMGEQLKSVAPRKTVQDVKFSKKGARGQLLGLLAASLAAIGMTIAYFELSDPVARRSIDVIASATPTRGFLHGDTNLARRVKLQDGSSVVLGAGSELSFNFDIRARNLELLRGKARCRSIQNSCRRIRMRSNVFSPDR